MMGIPQFSPIFWDKEVAASLGKIVESSGWGQSDILEFNRDKSSKKHKFQGGDRDTISREFGHPNVMSCCHKTYYTACLSVHWEIFYP